MDLYDCVTNQSSGHAEKNGGTRLYRPTSGHITIAKDHILDLETECLEIQAANAYR